MSDQLSSDLASLRIPRDVPPERGRALRSFVIGAIALAIVAGLYLVGVPYFEAKVFRQVVEATEIVLVSPAQSSVELTSSGYVVAETKSKVGAKVPGRLAEIHVKEGDVVERGALIAELDDIDQESAIAAGRSRVLAAKARAETAGANLAEAKLQAERQRALAERGASPKATAQDLEARVHSLNEATKAAEAEVSALEAEVKTLTIALEHTKVFAPIRGTVVEKVADVGEMVGPSSNAIVELADFATLIVETDVPEGRLYRVKPGGPCEIVLDAYPGRRYRGEAVEIVPRVNRAKATVPVKVRFVDAPEGVLPEMAARVSFLEKALDADQMKEPPKLVVPAAAVAARGGSKVVFVLDGDQVRMRSVVLGEAFGSGYALREGPAAGTRVVKNPPATLDDGERVKERNE